MRRPIDPRKRRPLRVVVTAGPTREWLDDVRYLSNASTGRMGFEVARDALRRGAEVVLIHGPCALRPPAGAETVSVESTHDLMLATKRAVRGADLVVFAAAPADFRPAIRVRGKIKKRKGGGPHRLVFVQTSDVAATVGKRKGRRIHVGFALEVEDSFANALGKMASKNFDAIVLNGPANVGRGGGHAWFLTPDGRADALATADKRTMAREILDRVWPAR